METVFLSYHFADHNTTLYNNVVRLLEGLGMRTIRGNALGGGPLGERVKALIEGSDCLLSLMTQVDGTPEERAEKQKWVRDEYGHAKSDDIPAIAMVETNKGVTLGGAHAADEYIPLDRSDQLEAMIRLVETIGFWRDQVGSRVTVRVDPEDVAGEAASSELSRCKYREFVGGRFQAWQDTELVLEPGGVFAHLARVKPSSRIAIRVKSPEGEWTSPSTPQYCHVKLEKGGDA